MRDQFSSRDMQVLAEALGAVRDAWVLVALQLKDRLADQPSPQRDEIFVQVERHLARIRGSGPGTSEIPPKEP